MSEDDTGERDLAEDDDWFEQALSDDPESEDPSAEADPSDESGRSGDADSEGGEASDAEDGAPSSVDDQAPESNQSPEPSETGGFDAADPDPDELDAAFEVATQAASEGEQAEEPVASEESGDFGLGESDSPAIGGSAGGDGGVGGAPGDGRGADGDGGAGVGGGAGSRRGAESGGGDLFEDDFASAFGGGGESEEFDDDDFDSDIPRIDIGIEGLDRMIRGGVPERHLMVAIGSAGTGKTTFGLQYLNHGLENGENCAYITLEQSHESILDTAAEFGWDFEEYEADDQLAVIDLDPIEMANSLDNIRGELPTLIEDFDADRFVLDSVSLLEMMYDEQARRRTEVFDFTKSLKRAGVTTLLTSEADEDNPYASRHGIIEYLTDAVFILQYVRSETRETRLAVEIQKIRNANHSRETKPYEITDDGIDVYEQANIF